MFTVLKNLCYFPQVFREAPIVKNPLAIFICGKMESACKLNTINVALDLEQ